MSAAHPAAVPLISVIVPTYNCVALVEEALASLAGQTWRDFEVVVSDGNSPDGTAQKAAEFGSRLPQLTVLCRPDRGVYDAINLGVCAAKGTWCLVLGGDDRLHAPDTLARAAQQLADSRAALVYGDVRMMAPNGLSVPPGGRYAGPMSLHQLFRANICQQAIFYRRSVLDELGGFSLDFPVLADWELNLRLAIRRPIQWVDLVVTDYAATGMSARPIDPAAEQAMLDRVRELLLEHPRDRKLWPLHRVLLRHADVFRKRRQWRAMLRHLRTYGCLSWCRVMARISRR